MNGRSAIHAQYLIAALMAALAFLASVLFVYILEYQGMLSSTPITLAYEDNGLVARAGNYLFYDKDPDYFDSKDWRSVEHQEDRGRANDDGSLSKWAFNWYVTHGDSGYGTILSTLNAGDSICIDGVEYCLDGRLLAKSGTDPNDIENMLGVPDIIFSTCEGGTSSDGSYLMWIVWGHKS